MTTATGSAETISLLHAPFYCPWEIRSGFPSWNFSANHAVKIRGTHREPSILKVMRHECKRDHTPHQPFPTCHIPSSENFKRCGSGRCTSGRDSQLLLSHLT